MVTLNENAWKEEDKRAQLHMTSKNAKKNTFFEGLIIINRGSSLILTCHYI